MDIGWYILHVKISLPFKCVPCVYIYMSSGQSYLLNMPCPNSVVPYRLWGFQCSRKYRKWGIDIGSSPIGHEPWRFCATSETPRRSKTKLVLQWFCWLLIYAWDSISTNQNACTHTHRRKVVCWILSSKPQQETQWLSPTVNWWFSALEQIKSLGKDLTLRSNSSLGMDPKQEAVRL